jgi:hypothetical protein
VHNKLLASGGAQSAITIGVYAAGSDCTGSTVSTLSLPGSKMCMYGDDDDYTADDDATSTYSMAYCTN